MENADVKEVLMRRELWAAQPLTNPDGLGAYHVLAANGLAACDPRKRLKLDIIGTQAATMVIPARRCTNTACQVRFRRADAGLPDLTLSESVELEDLLTDFGPEAEEFATMSLPKLLARVERTLPKTFRGRG